MFNPPEQFARLLLALNAPLAGAPSGSASASLGSRHAVTSRTNNLVDRSRISTIKMNQPEGELGEMVKSADVVFFNSEGCPFCAKAKQALESAGIEFKITPIAPYRPALKDFTGKTSAPSVWIKGTYVGGCNDGVESWHGVMPMLANGKFEEMLKG
jgi:glutaredoxin 3